MANIEISNLNSAGSELFAGTDNFLNELTETDTTQIHGGKKGGYGGTFFYTGGYGYGGPILFSGGGGRGSKRNGGNFFFAGGGGYRGGYGGPFFYGNGFRY